MRQIVLADADSGVPDDEPVKIPVLPGRFLLRNQIHRLPLRGVFNGIADDIDQHLFDPQLVGIHAAVYDAVVPVGNNQSFVLCLKDGDILDAAENILKITGGPVNLHLAALDLGNVQDIVDQRQQVVAGGADLLQRVRNHFRFTNMVSGDIGIADDGVHRRPDIVGHIGKKIVLCLDPGLCRVLSVFFLRLFGFLQGLHHGLPVPDILVDILETHHDAHAPAGHEHSDKIDQIVPGTAFQIADKTDGELVSRLKLLQDVRKADFLLHPLPVFLRDHGVYIFRFGIRIPGMAQRVADGLRVGFVQIRVVQNACFRLHIADQPHGIVGVGQRCNHSIANGLVRFPLFPFFRNIRYEHHINAAVGFCFAVMAVVIHPADPAVPAGDPVFRIVHLVFVLVDLLDDGSGNPVVIFRMHHSPEGEPGQLLKLPDIRTAEDVKHGFVGINQLFRRFRFINEEPAGHMSADFLHNRKGILCQIKMLPSHNASVDCRQPRVSFPFGLL